MYEYSFGMYFLQKLYNLGKDVFSPEVESSPAPSSTEPQNIPIGVKQTSRTSSFEIENLLKTAEQVIKCYSLTNFWF